MLGKGELCDTKKKLLSLSARNEVAGEIEILHGPKNSTHQRHSGYGQSVRGNFSLPQ